MTAAKLLELIEQQDLLPASMVSQLRSQIQGNTSITADRVTQILVKKGQLTQFQATKLLAQLHSDSVDDELGLADSNELTLVNSRLDLIDENEANLLVLDESDEDLQLADDESFAADEAALVDEDAMIVDDGDLIVDDDSLIVDDDDVLVDDDAVVVDEDAVVLDDEATAKSAEPPSVPTEPSFDGPDLVDDSLVSDADAGLGTSLPQRPKGLAALFSGGKKKRRENRWDSPLLLIGGGLLVLLVLLLFSLIYLLNFESGDDLFKQAEDHYRGLSYTQAIAGYDNFLNRFPNHPNASQARVRTRVAQIRQLTDHSKDWLRALSAAERLLPEIKTEGEAFESAQGDLASLLPMILEGLAGDAATASDLSKKREFVDASERAHALVTNPEYMPSSVRKTRQSDIDESLEEIELVKWTINRDSQLSATVEAIDSSIADGQLQAAYAAREEFLSKYPQLRDHARLAEIMTALAAAEQQQIKPVSQTPKPSTKDHPVNSRFKVVLADRRGGAADALTGHVVYVLARGAVYALDAASGDVLWRRYVGRQSAVDPIPVGPLKGSDALVVDATRNELLRLESGSGKLVWRLPCPGPLTQPVVLAKKQHALVGCNVQSSEGGPTGQLLMVNLDTGAVSQGIELPRPISSPAAVDVDNNLVIQAADESSLYVLQLPELKALAAVALDHGPGSILVAPLPVAGAILLADNSEIDSAQLRVVVPVKTDDQTTWQPVGQPIRLNGHISSPMMADERRAIVVTDRGAIHVFELDTNTSNVVREIANVDATRAEPQVSFARFDENQLWIGDRQLTNYELQLSRGRLLRRSVRNRRDSFLAPIQRIDDVLIDVRRAADAQAATVSAISAQGGPDEDRIWQTTLAAPLANEVHLHGTKIVVAVTVDGKLFSFTGAALRSGKSGSALGYIAPTAQLSGGADVGTGTIFLNRRSDEPLVLVDRQNLEIHSLTASGSPTQAPIGFGEGILVPTDAGTVEFVTSFGEPLSKPFQPPLSADESISWIGPAVVAGEEQFVIADQVGRRYRVGLAEQPKPHLRAISQQESARRFIRNLAATGESIYAVARDAEFDVIVALDAGELSERENWPAKGRIEWGPVKVGDVVLVASSTDQLFCFGTAAELVWQTKTPEGGITGKPAVVGGDLLLTGKNGVLWRVAMDDGTEVAQFEVGEPLGTGPTILGKRVLVASHDGTVHVVDLPGND